MYSSTKDLQVIISDSEKVQLQEIINLLGSVETMLAHSPNLIPLDAFLNWSHFVHKWYWLFTININTEGRFSYNKLKSLVKELNLFSSDFNKNLKDTAPAILTLCIKAQQKANNFFTDITVGSVEADK
jgi:hypothetical protein